MSSEALFDSFHELCSVVGLSPFAVQQSFLVSTFESTQQQRRHAAFPFMTSFLSDMNEVSYDCELILLFHVMTFLVLTIVVFPAQYLHHCNHHIKIYVK